MNYLHTNIKKQDSAIAIDANALEILINLPIITIILGINLILSLIIIG